MPIYQYQVVEGERGCSACRKLFEVEQKMADEPFEKCPRCGATVRRIIGVPNISTHWGKDLLSDANLRRHGFTKLTNEGEGRFRKTP